MTDIEKFQNLSEKLDSLEKKKIRLEEQFKTKKQDLVALMKEIKDAGYDPNKLKETLDEKEAQLKSQVEAFEIDVEKVSGLLAKIEV